MSLLDDLGIEDSVLPEDMPLPESTNDSVLSDLGLTGITNVIPRDIQQSIDWANKKPVNRILDVVGDVLRAPKSALDKRLKGPGFQGEPTTPEEQLAKLQYEHPYLFPLSKAVAKSPRLTKFFEKNGPSFTNIKKEIDEGWLPSAAGGYLQSMVNAPISMLNVPLELANKGQIPYMNLEQYKPSNSLASDIGFGLGQAGGYIAPYSLASKALEGLRPATGLGGLATDLLKGGITGYSLGGEQGDLGRYLGGALGALAEPLQSLRTSKIAERIANRSRSLTSQFKKRYDSLFKAADKAGISTLSKSPNLPYGELGLFEKSKWGNSLNLFKNNPTLRNAHKLQSDLGKYVTFLDRQASLASDQIASIPKAIEAQKRLRGTLFQELNKSKKLGLDYQKLTDQYGKQVIPYKNKAIKEFMRGERTADDLLQNLNSSIKGKAKIKPKHPEIAINRGVKKVLPYGAGLGALYGGTKWLGNSLGGLLHGEE